MPFGMPIAVIHFGSFPTYMGMQDLDKRVEMSTEKVFLVRVWLHGDACAKKTKKGCAQYWYVLN